MRCAVSAPQMPEGQDADRAMAFPSLKHIGCCDAMHREPAHRPAGMLFSPLQEFVPSDQPTVRLTLGWITSDGDI